MTPPDHAGVGVVDDVELDGRAHQGDDPVESGVTRHDARPGGRGGLAVVGLFVLLVAPLVVALAALRRPQWFPILDLAMTELRVRDVGTAETPLIGLPGRIGVFAQRQGSHPGPLSFWMLAPGYRLAGASAWAMEVASVLIHAVAVAIALVAAHRRGGARVVLGVAVVLAVLMRGYGPGILTEPWNPYLPLLWWVVLLVAVWSVLDGDLVFLPVATFAGSVCAQTHAPYVGLVGGLGALAVAGALWDARRAGSHEPPAGSKRAGSSRAGSRRAWSSRARSSRARSSRARSSRVWPWIVGSAVLGAALWVGPVIDQLSVEPGNVTLLVEHFGDPPEEAVGLSTGVEMVLLHLDPWRLATGQDAATGSLVDASQAPAGSLAPGAAVLVAWVVAAVAAWRLRHRLLLELHLVVGVALALAVVSISRIFGQLWYYLMIWAWGITALVLLATGWTAAAALARRLGPAQRLTGERVGAVALTALVAVTSVVLAVEATDAEVPALPLSRTMAELTPPTLDALAAREVTGGGDEARYLATWSDTLYIGAQGITLVNELARHGIDVGVIVPWSVSVGRHRVRAPEDATAVVHLANGEANLARWRAKPGVDEVATVDPRTLSQQEEYRRLRSEVIDDLERSGLGELVADVDFNLFAVAIDPRVSLAAQDAMTRLLDLGLPTSVFVGPISQMDP